MATNLVLLSGGLDSAALLAANLHEAPCEALFVAYGQSAEREELRAAEAVAENYGVPLTVIRLGGLSFGSGEIRGRNAFLLQVALLAAKPQPTVVLLGVHAGTTYADCTPEFVALLEESFALQTGGEVTLAAPFMDVSKGDIFLLARKFDVPLEMTYSCERGGGPCGECLSCRDRERLFAVA